LKWGREVTRGVLCDKTRQSAKKKKKTARDYGCGGLVKVNISVGGTSFGTKAHLGGPPEQCIIAGLKKKWSIGGKLHLD